MSTSTTTAMGAAAGEFDGVSVLRSVGPPQAPWPGVLARIHDGPARYLVDAALLDSWPGWHLSGADHVLCIDDVVGHDEGASVAFSVCEGTLDAFLARRTSLAPGECVTIGVSLVRGLAQAQQLVNEGVATTWWLLAGGRPVLVPGGAPSRATRRERRADAVATSSPVEQPVAALRERGGAAGAAVADVLAAFAREPRAFAMRCAEAENACFAVAPAAALSTAATSAPLAVDVPHRSAEAGVEMSPLPAPGLRGWLARAAAQIREAVWRRGRATAPARAAGTAGSAEGVVGRIRAMARTRRGVVLAASAVATLVLAGGLALTAGGDDAPAQAGAATHAGDASRTASATTSAEPMPAKTPTSPTDPVADDPLAVAAWVLDSRRECGGDRECLATIMEDPARTVPAGAVDLPADLRTLQLVDDFGGALVISVSGTDEAHGIQYAVLVRTPDAPDGEHAKWLLRDVYDAAQQPL